MADKYIDYQEMEIYGETAYAALEAIESLNPGISAQREGLKERTEAVRLAKKGKRDKRDTSIDSRINRDDLTNRIIRNLQSLKSHIDGINKDEDFPDVDLRLFYEGGLLGDLSQSNPATALLRANYAMEGFTKSPDFPLKDPKQKKLLQLRDQLKAAIEEADRVRPEEQSNVSELKAAGEEWRAYYKGLKLIVRGLLIQTKRRNELSLYFRDELVNHTPRATEASAPPDQLQEIDTSKIPSNTRLNELDS